MIRGASKKAESGPPLIRAVTAADAEPIAAIYNHYVEDTIVTFEETPLTGAEMRLRIETISAAYPWLVLANGSAVLGYAYATRWQTRSAYRLTVETTVYVEPGRQHRGYGELLYVALIDALRRGGFHAALGGIALPNDPSVGLHEKLGFRKVAHLSEVGRKFEKWIDVGYWQLVL